MNEKATVRIEDEIMDELARILATDKYRGLNLDNPPERVRFVIRQFILAEKAIEQRSSSSPNEGKDAGGGL